MRLNLDPRRNTAMAYDFVVVASAWLFSFGLASDFVLSNGSILTLVLSTLIVVITHFTIFVTLGLYGGIWRYASLHDLRQIGIGVLAGTLISSVLLFIWAGSKPIPRTAMILHPMLVLVLMSAGRIVYRWFKEQRSLAKQTLAGKPVLILGSDEASFRLILQLQRLPAWEVVGVLDSASRNVGRQVLGAPISGTWTDLPRMVASTGARHALLAVSQADMQTRRRAFDLCQAAGVKLLIVPDLDDVISERVRFTSIRHVEVDDLLGRDSVQLDTRGLRQLLTMKTVLVTGAGGSIGSELCRQIARFKPREIVLYEVSEFGMYGVLETLHDDFPDIPIRAIIGDIKDQSRLFDTFSRYSPQVVFHAAAYKHVPLMETNNSWEAVRNNAVGTIRLLEAISRFPVNKLVFISTDKAVNPTNVMGASKRLAEMLIQLWALKNTDTETVIVRFGNVLGSTGSVVPKFRKQIEAGGPITITHPEIKRYFMSVSEATQLVMQAALLGDSGDILVLDMGKPVRIVDLAKDMIRLYGLPESSIEIQYTGLRPGEKLYEELLADGEATRATAHPKLRIARAGALPDDAWEAEVRRWLAESPSLLDSDVRVSLNRFVREYVPFRDPADNVVPLPVTKDRSVRARAV
ncbi:MAG: nucleoside-diphosphate sugar epimerase/dehydratase [Burkholderiaceae bacterium]